MTRSLSSRYRTLSPTRRLLAQLLPILLLSSYLLLTSPVLADFAAFSYAPPRFYPPPGGVRKWLREEDERYALFLEDRAAFVRKEGPDAASVEAFPTHSQQYTLWDFFLPAFRCPHSTERIGRLGDGGKWVCGMELIERQTTCVVYSVGINGESSFEADLLERAPGCEVWGYDFSVTRFGPEIENSPHLKRRAHFFPWGLGGEDKHGENNRPKMYTLDTLMALNGHTFIDVLKVDIEGAEFAALSVLIAALPPGRALPFGQLQLEVHAWNAHARFDTFLRWWETLERAGLRPFWTEPNLVYVNVLGRKPDLAEYSFMNIRGDHPIVRDY
ncbi:methyltransferase domain-containing protein [Amylostereum chailletii]|nr:methyltransferase domain-containing protein [Amylostereum chailletii]